MRRAPPPRAIIRARCGRGRRRDGRDGEQGGDGGEDRQQRAEEADPSAGEGERPVNLPHLSPLPLGSSWSLPDGRGRGAPGLGLPAVKVSPSPHSGSGRGGRSCPACLPLPPPVYTFAAPLQRSGGPRSGLLLGRGVHSHPTLESKGRRLGGDPQLSRPTRAIQAGLAWGEGACLAAPRAVHVPDFKAILSQLASAGAHCPVRAPTALSFLRPLYLSP